MLGEDKYSEDWGLSSGNEKIVPLRLPLYPRSAETIII